MLKDLGDVDVEGFVRQQKTGRFDSVPIVDNSVAIRRRKKGRSVGSWGPFWVGIECGDLDFVVVRMLEKS